MIFLSFQSRFVAAKLLSISEVAKNEVVDAKYAITTANPGLKLQNMQPRATNVCSCSSQIVAGPSLIGG